MDALLHLVNLALYLITAPFQIKGYSQRRHKRIQQKTEQRNPPQIEFPNVTWKLEAIGKGIDHQFDVAQRIEDGTRGAILHIFTHLGLDLVRRATGSDMLHEFIRYILHSSPHL